MMRYWASCKAEVNGEPAELSVSFDDLRPHVEVRMTLVARPQREFDVVLAAVSVQEFSLLMTAVALVAPDALYAMRAKEGGNG